jgi:phosphoenolpyruvate synthase/pyruvate phosphate dikinase
VHRQADGPLVKWLGDGEELGLALTGGKAGGLDRLAKLGLPTAGGMCLTSSAYRAHVERNGSGGRASELVAALPDEGARAELQRLVSESPLPAEVSDALEAALERMAPEVDAAGGLLAVRSSAGDEDSREASFAGQHDTLLGVPPDAVARAVVSCWASLWEERAVRYRATRGLAFEGAAMAVVVQPLVAADASAVVFTRNPMNPDADELVMNATVGLGEAIVSGAVTPDTFVVSKAERRIAMVDEGEKEGRTVAAAGGGTRWDEAPVDGVSLEDDAVLELSDLCIAAEQAYGHPLDLEAAYRDGRWYLLQARPITA